MMKVVCTVQIEGSLLKRKTEIQIAQGDATLENAEFKFDYYNGDFTSLGGINGELKNSLVYKTDNTGTLESDNQNLIVSGTPYISPISNFPTFLLGTVVITEHKAPVGYLKSDEVVIVNFKLSEDGNKVIRKYYDKDGNELTNGKVDNGFIQSGYTFDVNDTKAIKPFNETVISGDIEITKYDKDTDLNKAQGVSSLEGIKYAVINRSKGDVRVNDVEYQIGEVVEILTTNKAGYVKSSKLPYGTYDVEELRVDATIGLGDTYDGSNKLGNSVYANNSYLHSDNLAKIEVNKSETYTVEKQVVNLVENEKTYSTKFSNYVVRGELAFEKYDIDGKPMPFIPFLISLLDENGNKVESHVILTDKNGKLNTLERGNKVADKVNKLDQHLVDGNKYNGPLNEEASQTNIWFGQTPVTNTRGVALYGNYLIEELHAENNKGQDMLTLNTAVTKELEVARPENVAIDLNIRMESKALDVKSDSNVLSLGEDVEVQDTVQFTHLKTYNEYELVTAAVNVKKDGTTVEIGRSEPLRFTPEKVDNTNTTYVERVNKFTVDSKDVEQGGYVLINSRQ